MFAKSVVEIYNKKYPNDNRINECIKAIDLFNSGKITIEELKERHAYAAAYAAAYEQKVLQALIDFVNEN